MFGLHSNQTTSAALLSTSRPYIYFPYAMYQFWMDTIQTASEGKF
jgi:hypothetical protein